MMGVLIVRLQLPQRRRRPDLRTVAKAIATLQVAEGMALHGDRDDCIFHSIMASILRLGVKSVVPQRLLCNAEWRHRHIEAPGMRIQARIDDRQREFDERMGL